MYVYNGTSLVQVGGGNSGSSDEGSVAEIDIADIDLSGSIDDYVKGNKPSRLRVVKGSGDTKKVVGTLDITSDANGSTITEVFTTCYSAVPGSTEIFKDIKDLTAGGFTPGKVSTFNRCYNISASSLTTPASGAWSDWKRGTDYWTRYVLDLMVDSLPEALGEDEITNAVSGILG